MAGSILVSDLGPTGATGATGPTGPAQDLSSYVTLTGTETLTNKTLTGALFASQSKEPVVVVGTGFAGYTYNVIDGAIHFINANSTANGTLNIRGDSSTTLNSYISDNSSITCVLLVKNGTTGYYPSSVTIDGTSVTPVWQGGLSPSGGNASSIDSYVFSIIKTGTATYTVMASQTRFA